MWKKKETQYIIAMKRIMNTLKANFYEELKTSENCSKPSCLPSIASAVFHQNAMRITLVIIPKIWFNVFKVVLDVYM